MDHTRVNAEVDLRPGCESRITMESPEGEQFPSVGCYLEVVPNERLVFTDALVGGFQPSEKGFFTGIITLEEVDGKTRYTARALHKNEEDKLSHEKMGFIEGWGTAFDQLLEVVKDI